MSASRDSTEQTQTASTVTTEIGPAPVTEPAPLALPPETTMESKESSSDEDSDQEELDEEQESHQYLSRLKKIEHQYGFYTMEDWNFIGELEWKNFGKEMMSLAHTELSTDDSERESDKLAQKLEILYTTTQLYNIKLDHSTSDDKVEIALSDSSSLTIIQQAKESQKAIWGLDFTHPLPSKEIDLIIAAIKNSSITYLRFNQELTDEQAKQLMKNLESMPRLCVLSFSGKKLSPPVAVEFAKLAQAQSIRQILDRSSVLPTLGELLPAHLIVDIKKSLIFSKRMDIERAILQLQYSSDPRFKKAFQSHVSDSHTFLDDLNYSKEDYQRLVDILNANKNVLPLKISLFNDWFNQDFVHFLGTALQSNANINNINISISSSSDRKKRLIQDTILCIFESLATNTTLRNLHVFNIDCSEIADVLAKSLLNNTTLTHLELINCRFQEQQVIAILEALSNNPHTAITSLDLSGTESSDGIGNAISQLLLKNKTITNLILNQQDLHDKSCDPIAMALVDNTTLTEFRLSGNCFTDTGLTQLGHAIAKNSGLRRIDLNSWSYEQKYSADCINGFLNQIQLSLTLEQVNCCSTTSEEFKAVKEFNASRPEALFCTRAATLFQGKRQNNRFWNLPPGIIESVLTFLYPRNIWCFKDSKGYEQYKFKMVKTVSLIRTNITACDETGKLLRKWNTTYTSKDAEGKLITVTIFKPKPTSSDSDKSKEMKSIHKP